MERTKHKIKFEDRYIGFLIIGIGIGLFIVSFFASYYFLTEKFHITADMTSMFEPAFKALFLLLMMWCASLITKRGIEFYGKTRQTE